MHPLNKSCPTIIFSVFHFDISGNDIKEEQSLKIQFISMTFLVFHFEISGNDIKLEHL